MCISPQTLAPHPASHAITSQPSKYPPPLPSPKTHTSCPGPVKVAQGGCALPDVEPAKGMHE